MSNFVLTTVTFTVGFAQTAKLFFWAYLTKINLVFWCQNSTIYASIHDVKSGENQILFFCICFPIWVLEGLMYSTVMPIDKVTG